RARRKNFLLAIILQNCVREGVHVRAALEQLLGDLALDLFRVEDKDHPWTVIEAGNVLSGSVADVALGDAEQLLLSGGVVPNDVGLATELNVVVTGFRVIDD